MKPVHFKGMLYPARKAFAILIAITLALSVSCSRSGNDGNKGRQRGAIPVLVAPVRAKDMPVQIEAIGNVEAFSMVAVRPQITGPITQVHFEEGREVRAGDLLFSIDSRPLESALNQMRANLKRAEAQMASARLDYERVSNLFANKIASQQAYDTTKATFDSAVATVLADSAAVSNAQVSLGYTEIRSPIDGRTGGLALKAGNVVKASDDVLVTIAQIRPIYAAFSVPEQHLSAIQSRMTTASLPVTASVPGVDTRPVGRLAFVNNTVDTNTGTILLKAVFPNDDNLLWPGQFIRLTMTLSNLTQAIVVPSQAIQSGQNGEYVFVVQPDQTAEMRSVNSGVTYNGETVLEGELKTGETVVTDGQLNLVSGRAVIVKTAGAGDSSDAEKPQGPGK